MKRNQLAILLGILTLIGAIFAYSRMSKAGFTWSRFRDVLAGVDPYWLAAAAALILCTYVVRAVRWQYMIRPLAPNVTLWRLVVATCIGFTAVVMFGRAGEPVRPYLISRKEGVPFSSQIAVWFVERMLDLLMVLLIFGFALTRIENTGLEPGPTLRIAIKTGGWIAGLTGAASLALFIGLRQFRGRVKQRLGEALHFLPEGLQKRINTLVDHFDEGTKAAREGFAIWLLIFYSVIEWAVVAGAFFCVFRAFPAVAHFGWADVMITLGLVSFASAVQIPGIGGGIQIATVVVLTQMFGVGIEDSSGVALMLWAINFLVILPIGLVLAFHEGINWRNMRHVGDTLPPDGLPVPEKASTADGGK